VNEKNLFVEDIILPDMLFGLTLRSPIARGRLKAVEGPKLLGAYTLVRAGDIPGKNQLEDFPVPILASDTLSYIGEPVALLFGPDEVKLAEYAAQCRIITEEESPVFSVYNTGDDAIYSRREICLGDPPTAFEEGITMVNGTY
jgi:CO/xanthine dehydrogenase Mo-binding subunit